MTTYNIIAAFDLNYTVGVNGKIPWKCSIDMKRFKELTVGSAVIMGRLTWESLPKKPLPNRTNIVVSSTMRDNSFCYVAKNMLDAIDIGGKHSDRVFFIGGYKIWKDSLSICDNCYLTIIKTKVSTSNSSRVSFFPKLEEPLDIVERVKYNSGARINGNLVDIELIMGRIKHGLR